MCSEKREIVFRGAFLTILFPIDRFAELGPSSRTFFSEGGFPREKILELIHSFYQVNFWNYIFLQTQFFATLEALL